MSDVEVDGAAMAAFSGCSAVLAAPKATAARRVRLKYLSRDVKQAAYDLPIHDEKRRKICLLNAIVWPATCHLQVVMLLTMNFWAHACV